MFSQLCLAMLLLVAGILIVGQLRTQHHSRAATYERDMQAVLLSELVNANHRLHDELNSLTAKLATYEDEHRGAILEELVAELNRVRVLNGAVEVSGPGIELYLDGPLSALDLQDLINELRNTGAEAISLNEQRVVVHSVPVIDDRGTIKLDGQFVRRPYRIQAIGDPHTMETALLRPGGLALLLQRAYPSLVVRITQYPHLVLGVHRYSAALQYALPVE
jgi:uncharacterized protein YlxW (UPF0749 family)